MDSATEDANRITPLPYEIQLGIFCEMTDMKSVMSLARAYHHCKAIFRANEERIVSTIYFRKAYQITARLSGFQSSKFVKLAILSVCYRSRPLDVLSPWVLDYISNLSDRMPQGICMSEFARIISDLDRLFTPLNDPMLNGVNIIDRAWARFQSAWTQTPNDDELNNSLLTPRDLNFLLQVRIHFGCSVDPFEPCNRSFLLRLARLERTGDSHLHANDAREPIEILRNLSHFANNLHDVSYNILTPIRARFLHSSIAIKIVLLGIQKL
ncbi:hypothetical protein F5B22DRAFT_393800 [Xylaria bambusicola]|uniref:uncharacterized protein n=1 Tax=Xylaria bambusicola TaxID=326684 RepID=UPI00200776A1|nr:uncharacterized protein F5B22DRAFT_393800 [Xylaria bambusicola]KAI0508607.1 hypothetical protein F5B22DRAFT_393800 [Xylaria bambusicola]